LYLTEVFNKGADAWQILPVCNYYDILIVDINEQYSIARCSLPLGWAYPRKEKEYETRHCR
ncbi:MAG: hypothetical protein J6L94_07120, partial [Acidaminococcaceae bacterium]|nr:hypothetical protein [Acidaminococcaceae bacterium]